MKTNLTILKILNRLNFPKKLSLISLILGFSCFSSFFITEVSDSGWLMYRSDIRNSGSVSDQISSNLDLLWKFKIGGGIISTALVTDRLLILGGLDKKLYFLDPQTGRKLKVLSFSGGIGCTPVIKDSLLFFGTQRGGDSFYALNLKTFKTVWEKKLKDINSSPIINKEKIFIGTGDGSIQAMEIKKGKELWQFKTQEVIKASAVLDSNWLWLGSLDNYMYCLSQATGELIWKFKCGGGIYSSAAIDSHCIYFGCADGLVYALDKNTGSKIWSYQTQGPIYSSPAVSESLVYIGSNDHTLYALSKSTGEKVWSFACQSLIHSSPIVVGDKIAFGSLDGNFYVLDSQNGQLIFKYATTGMIKAAPAYHKGRFYLGSYDRHLYCWGK